MDRLSDALRRNADQFGDRTAFGDGETKLTWRELAVRVGGGVEELGAFDETIGITGRNGVEWVIAFLAASLAGKTVVPVPMFFSSEQRAGIIADAGIKRILHAEKSGNGQQSNTVPCHVLSRQGAPLVPGRKYGNGALIIYTSGSTGQPKGVRLEHNQAIWTAMALAEAVEVDSTDKYLSLLPLPMLLEIICAIIIPVLTGGQTVFEPDIADAVVTGRAGNLVDAFEQEQPGMTVMVPKLLGLYAMQLAKANQKPPESLKYVAVGGAPLPPFVATAATRSGIPFFEGYGLSECASVVAVNRPGAAWPGTVGKPLPGLFVEIDEGEIIVSGPSVMDGYLHGESCSGRWRTGDLGEIDADGFLRVQGRRDNLIVTPSGRNISPEWIEALLLGDPRIAACALVLAGQGAGLGMLIIPSEMGIGLFRSASDGTAEQLVQQACHSTPEYARPRWVRVLRPGDGARYGMLTSNGQIRRAAAARYVEENVENRIEEDNETI